MTRIAIVGSSQLFREALARMLTECGHQVVAHVEPGAAPTPSDAEPPIDVVLTETPGRSRSTADWLQQIGARFPDARVILLTSRGDDPEALLEALANGAHGYLQNSQPFETVRTVVDAVAHGQMVYPGELRLFLSRISAGVPSAAPASPINGHAHERIGTAGARADTDGAEPVAGPEETPPDADGPQARVARTAEGERELSVREREILGELAQGNSNKVIAFRLQLSEATVKSHLKSLLRKLGFTNRTQAAIFALKNPGLVRSVRPPAPPGSDGRR